MHSLGTRSAVKFLKVFTTNIQAKLPGVTKKHYKFIFEYWVFFQKIVFEYEVF